MNMANASKNLKIINIRFNTTLSLLRSHVFHYQCRIFIEHMCCPFYCFCPGILWNLLLRQHVSNHVHDFPVFVLSYSILLGSVGCSELHDNTISFAKGIELERYELFTHIYARTMNKNSCLFLNKVFIILEDSKSFRFLSKKIYPHLRTVIINRTYKIPLLTTGNMFDGPADVNMYQLQSL